MREYAWMVKFDMADGFPSYLQCPHGILIVFDVKEEAQAVLDDCMTNRPGDVLRGSLEQIRRPAYPPDPDHVLPRDEHVCDRHLRGMAS